MKEMADLPIEDRQTLIDNNAEVTFTFKSAAHFGEEGKGQKSPAFKEHRNNVLPEYPGSNSIKLFTAVIYGFS
jgi:hypothetical protein